MHLIMSLMALMGALFGTSEQTLSIIKPDAVEQGQVEEIQSYLKSSGLKVVESKQIQLTREEAKEFYAVHKDRPFYEALVEFMTSGPVVVQKLEGEDAVALNRKVMGATDPSQASSGTIRADFGTDVQRNAVHGSDSIENAKKEIAFFFSEK